MTTRQSSAESRPHQFGVAVDAETLARLDRLRCIRGEARTRVAQLALIGGGLDRLEHEHFGAVQRYNALALRSGAKTWQAYAVLYAARYASKTYPPSLSDLEEMESRGLKLVAGS